MNVATIAGVVLLALLVGAALPVLAQAGDLADEGRERAQRVPEALAEASVAAKEAFTGGDDGEGRATELGHQTGAAGNQRRRRVPRPGAVSTVSSPLWRLTKA